MLNLSLLIDVPFIATKKSFKFDYETERQYWDSYSDIEKPLVNYVKTKFQYL